LQTTAGQRIDLVTTLQYGWESGITAASILPAALRFLAGAGLSDREVDQLHLGLPLQEQALTGSPFVQWTAPPPPATGEESP
jgi:hypothetical protein